MSSNVLEKSLRIGRPVVSSTSGSVLYIDSNGALAQNNTALFWDNTNVRIGIGNGAPSTQLHLTASAASAAGFLITVTGGKGYALAFGASLPGWVDTTTTNGRTDASGNFVFNSGTGGDIYFNYDNQSRNCLFFGNTGVNELSPDTRFHITGLMANTGFKIETTNGKGYALCFGAAVPAWVDTTSVNGRIDNVGDFVFNSGTGGDIYFNYDNQSRANLFFGNVGINELSPDTRFHITGTSANTGMKIEISAAQGLAFAFGSSAPAWVSTASPWTRTDTSGNFVINSGSSGDLYLNVDNTARTTRVSGNFLFQSDNANDIGASGATRPRRGFFGTALLSPLITAGGTTELGILHIAGDNARPFTVAKSTVVVTAPGAGVGLLRWENGTNAGTLKLVAYSGTSITGVTIVDNVGSGN